MTERNQLNCHVLSNTHWDREWRYPFRSYQMDLVDFMDRLLDILEQHPDYRSFYLDSQTLLLEDYLSIRPENRERIKCFVMEDRLEIGPWYTLPDCWGCPGEALVRNLLFGHRDSADLGGTAKVGYTPFSNGQISQMPQLYRGFGIDSIMFYRGIGKHIAPSDFIWQGPDGSRLFAFRFGDYARYNYYYLVYRNGLFGRTCSDRDFKWCGDETPYHVATDQQQDRQYGWLNQKLSLHPDMLRDAMDDAVRMTEPDAQTTELLYMMGHDHSFAAVEEIELIKALVKEAGPNGEHIFHSSLLDYMKAFREKVKDVDLKVVTGEMRHTLKEGLWTTLMALILSCRLYLKQRNAQVSRMVLDGAEPLAAMAWITGSKYPKRFLEIAWRHMLANQAHDAIGGCSVDKVHAAMMTRWDEVETIADELSRRSMRDIATRINGIDKLAADDIQLTVFNTLPVERPVTAELDIDIPIKDGKPMMENFGVFDLNGTPLKMQLLRAFDYDPTIESGYETTLQFMVKRHRVALQLEALPACGWNVYAVRPMAEEKEPSSSLVKNETCLENDYLRVEVNANGTVRLTDKINHRVMDELLYLEDAAEFGDPWNRKFPEGEVPILSKDIVTAKTSVVVSGALTSTLKIEYSLPLPAGKEGTQRSQKLVEMPIAFDLTLHKDSRMLEVALNLDNQIENHRLRLMMPSGIADAVNSYADGQFDVLERVIKLPNSDGWKEKPFPTHPMWSFVGVSASGNGFTVLEDGLTEYEVLDDAQRTIAITLMRTFGAFVYGRLTPGSQCKGPHSYRFAIVPHRGTWADAEIPALVKAWQTPVYALESTPTKGTLACRHSMLEVVSDGLQISGIKQAENGNDLVVRLYNPFDDARKARIILGMPVKEVTLLTMEELPLQKLNLSEDNSLELPIEAKCITTLGIKWQA